MSRKSWLWRRLEEMVTAEFFKRLRAWEKQETERIIYGDKKSPKPKGLLHSTDLMYAEKRNNRPRRGEMRAGTASTEAPLGAK